MFKVRPTDEHWELLADIHRVSHGKVIAQSMQNASKYHVRFSPIFPIQFLHQVFEPTIRPLNCVIKDFEAREFHAYTWST